MLKLGDNLKFPLDVVNQTKGDSREARDLQPNIARAMAVKRFWSQVDTVTRA
jgi:hypothetical protein